jgi:hypothetical protein
VIDTPPPTASGTLHMGHMFSYTKMRNATNITPKFIVARYYGKDGISLALQLLLRPDA